MPSQKIHRAISKKRTGKTFKALHEWIDEGWGLNKEGVDHRSKRHFYTKELRKEIIEKFEGPEVINEWIFHIALDNLDTSLNGGKFKDSKRNFLKFGFEDSGFIHYKEGNLNPEDFLKEFPDD